MENIDYINYSIQFKKDVNDVNDRIKKYTIK